MTLRIRLVPLVVLTAALAAAPVCQPGPHSARNVQIEFPGCGRAYVTWGAPPEEPASYDIEMDGGLALSVPGWQTQAIVWSNFPRTQSAVTLRSRSATGESLGLSISKFYAAPRCNTPSVLRMKVLLFDLDPPAGTGRPWTFAEVENLVFGPELSVRDAIRENSFGQQTVTGSVSGYFPLNGSSYCEWNVDQQVFDRCDALRLQAAAVEVAAPSVDFSQYDRLLLLMGGKGNGGSAFHIASDGNGGSIPARIQTPLRVSSILHELGHIALTEDELQPPLGHAGRMHCSARVYPADPSDMLADCIRTSSEGDIEPMTSIPGRSASLHYSAFHKERMGWIPPKRTAVYHAWTVEPQELWLHDVTRPATAEQTQLLRVLIGRFGYEYFAEYRLESLSDDTPTGSNYLNGVVVRLASRHFYGDWGQGIHDANVPDTVISSQGLIVLDAANPVFDDPDNDVRIEFLEIGPSNKARVRVGPSSGVLAP